MRGAVDADGREARLGIEVLSPAGSPPLLVEAVVDTGFTGHITLPPATVEALGLPIIGSAESVLEDVCAARVLRHAEERPVRALVADVTPLPGMALLGGSEPRVECVGGGEVTVEELSGG